MSCMLLDARFSFEFEDTHSIADQRPISYELAESLGTSATLSFHVLYELDESRLDAISEYKYIPLPNESLSILSDPFRPTP